MVAVTAMDGPFGAFIDDVDLGRDVDADVIDALYEHHILVIRRQQLSHAAYARFGARWGEPILFFNPRDRHAEFPELIKIDNSPATPEPMRDGAMHWHQDSSYEAVPASVTMLYAIEAPEDGNDTLFADLVAAYDALPEEIRQDIDGLEVRHSPTGGRVALEGEKRGGGSGAGRGLPAVTHPLVIRHPFIGRRALYGISGTADGIVGMDDGEAIELLVRLKRHALQPAFQQRARADVGSVLVWDNFAVMHCATPTRYSDAAGERRLLYRISTRGVPVTVAPGSRVESAYGVEQPADLGGRVDDTEQVVARRDQVERAAAGLDERGQRLGDVSRRPSWGVAVELGERHPVQALHGVGQRRRGRLR